MVDGVRGVTPPPVAGRRCRRASVDTGVVLTGVDDAAVPCMAVSARRTTKPTSRARASVGEREKKGERTTNPFLIPFSIS